VVAFPGSVDFPGARAARPGPDLFPVLPGTHAGPVDDRRYSPLFMFGNGVEQIANATGVHPRSARSTPAAAAHAPAHRRQLPEPPGARLSTEGSVCSPRTPIHAFGEQRHLQEV
jgi:hypothetical protein